jgi:hypothetical protein
MLEFGTSSRLSRLARAGGALRLAPSIYAVGAILPPEQVTRHHLFAIIGHVWPGAVLHGRTALTGGRPSDGEVHVAHPEPPRKTALSLPGTIVHAEVGPGSLPGDMPLPHGVFLAGQARTLVSNVPRRGRPPRSCAGTEAAEDKVDELARRGGAGRIRQVLGELDVIAGSFEPHQVEKVRQMLAAVLGTITGPVSSQRLQARLAGMPYDTHRLERLEAVLGALQARPPITRPVSGPENRFAWEPFFEAYFSNFIEGTEFGVEQARRIAIDGEVPDERPADAHDVAATYRLVVDPDDRARVPGSSDEFIGLLRDRHAVLMAARPDKHPGQFKQQPNYAGGYRFVDPELVEGTLRRGFDRMAEVIDPMARAVATMVLVTECHPFDDGNGRVARLMSNSELSHAGQIRVVTPTSFRNNYLAALSGVSSGNGDGQSLHAVLDFAQRWVSRVDWTSFETAHRTLEETNAYREPGEAELSGNRLRLPE